MFVVMLNGRAKCLQHTQSCCQYSFVNAIIRARMYVSLAKNKRSIKRDFSLAGNPRRNDVSTGDHSLMKSVLGRLDEPEFEIGFTTYTSLLKYCRQKEALVDGKRVHKHISNAGLQQDLYVGSLLILMYSDCGALDEAHAVFKDLLQHDELVFTLIMRAFARLDSPIDAFQTFEQMHQEGLIPNKRIFISMFCACTSVKALLHGKQIHARFFRTTFSSDIATKTALINMYNKCNRSEHARWIFESIDELDAIAWNVMIASCLEKGQSRDALQLFRHMEQQGVTPSKVTFLHVLDACGNELALSRGTQLHCHIMDSEVELDIIVQTALINMYGKCVGLKYAEKIFGKMIFKDEVVWSAMISAYSENSQVRNGFQLFEQMLQECIFSNKYILSSILSGCAAELMLRQGKQMHARITCSGFALDVPVGNALISLYGKMGCLSDAWKTFYKMLEHDMVSWNAMIAACAEHRELKGAYQIFHQMQQQSVLADKATFVNALSAYSNQVALEEGKRVHACMLGVEFKTDMQIDNALLNMYGKCGNVEIMSTIFEQMKTRNAVSWNTVISVYAQNGKYQDALQHFEEMQEDGIHPDRLTFTSVLNVCANQVSLSEGKRLHELFNKKGFTIDQVVGSTLISLYGKCGCLAEARQVFDCLLDHDIVIWNSLITAFSLNGQGECALEFFNCMLKERVRPTGVTFISVLSACSHVGLVDEACYHFNSMEMCYGLTPIVDHYNCMIDLFGRAGRIEEAEELLNNMTVEPTMSSLMTLLGACRNLLDCVRGQRIADKVFKMDPQSPSPYVMLSNIFATAGRADDAINVMKIMRSKHIKLDAVDGCDTVFDEDFMTCEPHLKEVACVA